MVIQVITLNGDNISHNLIFLWFVLILFHLDTSGMLFCCMLKMLLNDALMIYEDLNSNLSEKHFITHERQSGPIAIKKAFFIY